MSTPTFESALELYLSEQRLNECSVAQSFAAERLKPSFTGLPLNEITALRINEHTLRRKQSGAANGTINRELAALRRMFSLAQRYGLIESVPFIQSLKEASPRQGFVNRAEFQELLEHLPKDTRPLVEFLYLSAWRKREVMTLQWGDVDLDAGVIRLRPERSKNKQGRVLPLRKRLLEIIQTQHETRNGPYVFHRKGKQILDIRKAWSKATKDAGLSGLLIHDLRRSGIRNLVRAGVTQSVAMKISGHRTISTFQRYNITDETDIAQAIEAIC